MTSFKVDPWYEIIYSFPTTDQDVYRPLVQIHFCLIRNKRLFWMFGISQKFFCYLVDKSNSTRRLCFCKCADNPRCLWRIHLCLKTRTSLLSTSKMTNITLTVCVCERERERKKPKDKEESCMLHLSKEKWFILRCNIFLWMKSVKVFHSEPLCDTQVFRMSQNRRLAFAS